MSRYQSCGVTNCFYDATPGSSFCMEHQPDPLIITEKEDKPKVDMVNHPPHYNSGKYEVIDVLEDSLKEGFEPYCIGNVMKYIMRYKNKNGIQDLEKAYWYLDRVITHLKEKAPK